MDIEQFLLSFNEKTKKLLTQGTGDNALEPLYDGPLDPEEYFNCNSNGKKKILLLLKEPYGTSNAGSSMAKWFQDEQFLNKTNSLTWKRVAYINHGILNPDKLWDNMDDYNPEMKKELKHISWVNIQKVPYKDASTADERIMIETINNPEILCLIKEQINLLSPDVIICGNTFKYLCNNVLKSKYLGSIDGVNDADYRIKGKTIIIDAYHPAIRADEESYVDNVIKAVRAGLSHIQ